MKKFIFIIGILGVLFFHACKEPERIAGFEDAEQYSIYDYIIENKDTFSNFLSILEAGGIDKTLSAYNPDGTGYTLFLPDNNAIANFINNTEQISTVNDIINDAAYAAAFSRYHVVNMAVHSNDFPFGAFPQPTLSEDFLTVSFIIETDTSYYKINNQAAVTYPNIEVSNGYVHLVQSALEPITFTSYQWLEQNSGYSIFKEAIDQTGFQAQIDFNMKDDDTAQPVTLLVEPDAIYQENGINSFADLANFISPDDQNYTSVKNPLYNYIAYHVLTGSHFIDDFEGEATNYTTLSEIPLNINGMGIDLAINIGKQVFDTIVYQGDTTFVDFIGFLYDESNVLTQSGAIHFINRVMTQQTPSRAIRNFEFWEEPYINALRQEPGTHLIEAPEALYHIEWSGADLSFVELGDQESSAWGNDYLEITGDFEISYQIPKIIQGKYEVYLRAESFSTDNAVVEVFIDGKKVSGIVDLSRGGSANSPFQTILLGTVDFSKYESHKVEIRPLIPGRFLWDVVRFEPI